MYAHAVLGVPQAELWRDYTHLGDYGRLVAAYGFYTQFTGKPVTEIKLTTIPANFFKSTMGSEDRTLTEMEKAILIESVNNALTTQLSVTQSQYTEAPAIG